MVLEDKVRDNNSKYCLLATLNEFFFSTNINVKEFFFLMNALILLDNEREREGVHYFNES